MNRLALTSKRIVSAFLCLALYEAGVFSGTVSRLVRPVSSRILAVDLRLACSRFLCSTWYVRIHSPVPVDEKQSPLSSILQEWRKRIPVLWEWKRLIRRAGNPDEPMGTISCPPASNTSWYWWLLAGGRSCDMDGGAMARSAVCIGDPELFASEMIKTINAKEYSDVSFIVGEEKRIFYAHRCILAARCEVFRAMFAVPRSDEASAPLVLSDIKPNIFLAVLEYAYTNCCSLSSEMVIDVLAAAVEYGMDGLIKLCVRFMWDSINAITVCEFLQAALTYQQTALQEECLSYIEANTQKVFSSQGFNEMSEDALVTVLQSDHLLLDEADILNKVTEWATVNSVVTGASLCSVAKKVIHHVRFPLLDPEHLSRVEKDNEKAMMIPVTLIAAAWKFHALKKPKPMDPQTRPRKGTCTRESLAVVGRGP